MPYSASAPGSPGTAGPVRGRVRAAPARQQRPERRRQSVSEVVGLRLVPLPRAVARGHREGRVLPAGIAREGVRGGAAVGAVVAVPGVQMPQLMAEDDQPLHRLRPLLDDDQVEVLELHAQTGHFDLVREPLEPQLHRPSAAPRAHLGAQCVAQLADVRRGWGLARTAALRSEASSRIPAATGERRGRNAAATRAALLRAPAMSIAPPVPPPFGRAVRAYAARSVRVMRSDDRRSTENDRRWSEFVHEALTGKRLHPTVPFEVTCRIRDLEQ